MRNKAPKLMILSALSCMAGSLNADTISPHHMIIAPTCLVTAAGISAKPLAEMNQQVLLDADDETVARLMKTKSETMHSMKSCGDIQDVTRKLQESHTDAKTFMAKQSVTPKSIKAQDYRIQYRAEVKQLLATINPQNMWTNLTTLTHFDDRHANSATGIEATDWIKKQLNAMIGERTDVSVYTIPTTGYKQPSVVLKIGDSPLSGIVVSGGNIDTPVSYKDWFSFIKMPGAAANGSGAVTALEAARAILASGMHFQRPLYFVWYAAEKEGRVGSSDVVSAFQFQDPKISVRAVLDFSTVGVGKDRTMWLVKDYADASLNQWLASLVHTYVKQIVLFEQHDTSSWSHASWTGAGVPASSAIGDRWEHLEALIGADKYDTMDKLSLVHMTDYLKLAIAFAVEGAEPTQE